MFMSILFQIEVFLLIMAIFVVAYGILHIVSVFRLERGKIITSRKDLVIFSTSLAYIIMLIICGFVQ